MKENKIVNVIIKLVAFIMVWVNHYKPLSSMKIAIIIPILAILSILTLLFIEKNKKMLLIVVFFLLFTVIGVNILVVATPVNEFVQIGYLYINDLFDFINRFIVCVILFNEIKGLRVVSR